MDKPENLIVKVDEKYNKLTSSLDSRLKKIEEKGDMNMDEHINEIEDLVLLMQLELTKMKEKMGGIELGLLPSGDVHARIDELEEKIKTPQAKEKENLDDFVIEGENEEVKTNAEINIDEIKQKIDEHKESISSELDLMLEQINVKMGEMQSHVLTLDKNLSDVDKKISESETKQGMIIRNAIDDLNKKMTVVKMPNFDEIDKRINEMKMSNNLDTSRSLDAVNKKIEEIKSQLLFVNNETRDSLYRVETKLRQIEDSGAENRIEKIETFIEKEFAELDKRLSKIEDKAYNDEEPNKSYVLNEVTSILKR